MKVLLVTILTFCHLTFALDKNSSCKLSTVPTAVGEGCPPLMLSVGGGIGEELAGDNRIRPGHPEWPMAWVSYRKVKSLKEDIKDLKAHGVGLITQRADTVEEARKALQRRKDVSWSSGEYLGHKWHIDENHLMWWDGKPYVPFGGFGIKPGNEFGLNTFNLWIDFDPFIEKPYYTRKQHRADIAQKLDAITKAGGTCIVQFSMALPHIPEGPKPGMRWREPEGGIDGLRLADTEVRHAILKVWEYYAPAVRKECVRAIVLWNEINVWRWPERMPAEKYGQVLGEYAREVKRMVGDLPVCFKIAGTWNAAAVIAGAAVADGLGFDVWFTKPDDTTARREIERALRMLETRQKKTTWFFIAEGGRGIAERGSDDAPAVDNYWDRWPPFRSKKEARGILRAYVQSGAKGFIYNGPTSGLGSKYRSSYRWLGELKPEVTALMVEMQRPLLEARRAMTAERAIAAARADERVGELVRGLDDVWADAEFAERWQVWLVYFFAGDRRVGFASVSEDGKVLEVGAAEENEKDSDDRSEEDDEMVTRLSAPDRHFAGVTKGR